MAGNQIPDLAHFLPEGASWERFEDRGDTQRWLVRGHLGIDIDAQAFLDASATKIADEDWAPVADPDRKRRSFVRTRDGQTWRFSLALVREAEPSTYQLTLAVRQLMAGRKSKPAKG